MGLCMSFEKFWLVGAFLCLHFTVTGLEISSADPAGVLNFNGAFPGGICSAESAPVLGGIWRPETNVFTTNSSGQIAVHPSRVNRFFRLLAVDISTNSPSAFSNLVNSYGVLETIAGKGAGSTDGVNYWQSSFEGGPATSAALSRPHFAMTDSAGNIFVVDKDSHSVLKITADGKIHTVAGTHQPGNGTDASALATTVALTSPNGLWVNPNGTVYVLDTGNGKIRKLGTDGMMSTFVNPKGAISGGRALWVSSDEQLVYYANGTDIKRWRPNKGFDTMNNKPFVDPGNLLVNPNNELIVTDRGANRVYRLNKDGSRDAIAGDGSANGAIDGTPALNTGIYGVRGIWYLPNGGYLLATHEGSQILYVDAAGILRIFLDGSDGSHSGDGEWFYTAGAKISQPRSITLDNAGNILIVENDAGYVRRIRFQRLNP
jgi:hypothetical protein